MLLLDFINVGNGDATLVRDYDDDVLRFAMLVDCGYDEVTRPDGWSQQIHAADFLRQEGITHLDLVVLTHYHRDHTGGLGRVLEQASVDELMGTYFPPKNAPDLDPEGDNDLPKVGRNVLRWLNVLAQGLNQWGHRVQTYTTIQGDILIHRDLGGALSMEILPGEPGIYPRQTALYQEIFAGVRNRYDLMKWGKTMNPSSLRLRLHYHGKDIVIGGDLYGVLWDADTTAPCHILKVPHHGSISSVTRKMLTQLHPDIAVISTAGSRHDEKPHPYILSLLQEICQEVHITDAVDLPGLVTPKFHTSVKIVVNGD